ncbi:TetR/AcrR family transcriptional regulator [Actinopolymorpha alba]|uniref:TetR/AcrR family transcriptional regulator n=1 Tax=Actinopolymorpha alba TaxID=533267 RepID=UPI0003809F80|nr:TetR/AcrR family transcriptional regulator [Actinopolymorpha alba]
MATAAEVPIRGRAAKRSAILRAARQVFLRHGYQRASVDDIASEAGVSKQTIYNQFGGKEALFLSAVEEMFLQLNADTLAALESFPDRPRDLEAELIAFGRRLGACLFEGQAVAVRQLIEAEAFSHPDLAEASRERGPGRMAAALSARLSRLAHARLLEVDDPDVAARHFMALVTYDLKSLADRGPEGVDSPEFDAVVTTGVRAFLRAYTP